jgi:hypothetical protein
VRQGRQRGRYIPERNTESKEYGKAPLDGSLSGTHRAPERNTESKEYGKGGDVSL